MSPPYIIYPPYKCVLASSLISTSLQILAHRSELLRQTEVRRAQLHASLSLQQFLRDAEEATGWVKEKSKVAGDASYKVSTGLEFNVDTHRASPHVSLCVCSGPS